MTHYNDCKTWGHDVNIVIYVVLFKLMMSRSSVYEH